MLDHKCDRPKRMTAEERAIWAAVYSAEYVRRFGGALDVAGSILPRPSSSDFDWAIDKMSAEGPIYVANAAVNDLRQWRRDGND